MKITIASVWGMAACAFALSAAPVAAQTRDADLSSHDALRAASAQRASQRAGIAQERKQNLAQRKQAEVKCYRLFAVEDCLWDARNEWRLVETRLRTQEVQINDAERKEKAQERLRQIEEKQSSAADATGPAAGASAASATVRNPTQGGKSATREKSPGTVVLRDREAQERASQQRARQSSQAAEQSAREKESAERAAKARQRQLDAEKASEARRARRDKERARSAADGHKPAASLPTPP